MMVTAERQRYQREHDTEKHPSTVQDLAPPTHERSQYIRRLRSWSSLPSTAIVQIRQADCGIALWLIVTTVREVRSAADDFLWPEEMVCAHPEAEAPLAMSG